MKSTLIDILSVALVGLFLLNYPIAEWLAPWDADPDNNLSIRFNEYALIICGAFIISIQKQSKFSKTVMQVGIGLCIGDLLDRFVFNTAIFQWNDLLTIVISLSTSYYNNYVRKGC